jgi:hypothetical protein
MNEEKLVEDNFLLFCVRHYRDVKFSSIEDVMEDINRVKYIKKLITRYVEGGSLKERLILNHIIILNNCFGPVVLCKILYLKLKDQMKYVKPFLILLDVMQNEIRNVGDELLVDTRFIAMEQAIVERLRGI